jgi:hypothetical protein
MIVSLANRLITESAVFWAILCLIFVVSGAKFTNETGMPELFKKGDKTIIAAKSMAQNKIASNDSF